MLYCSSECGSIPIMQLRTIYCNAHVHTFHVCLCLLALTFVCNSTYLLKCSFQIYQKSIVYIVFIRSSKVYSVNLSLGFKNEFYPLQRGFRSFVNSAWIPRGFCVDTNKCWLRAIKSHSRTVFTLRQC